MLSIIRLLCNQLRCADIATNRGYAEQDLGGSIVMTWRTRAHGFVRAPVPEKTGPLRTPVVDMAVLAQFGSEQGF
jgi:hypothetical protein